MSLVNEMYGILKESSLNKDMFTVVVIDKSRPRVQVYTYHDEIKLGFRNLVLRFDNPTDDRLTLLAEWNLSAMIEEDEDFVDKLTELWRLYSL